MNVLKNLPLILSGCISGLILYQSIMIAPSINKLLNAEDASIYLRYIWPKFFIIIGLIALISFLVILFFNTNQNTAKILTILSFLLMILCYLIIPSMNEAKDSFKESTFMILHFASIIMTIITLILNISVFIFWKY
tara:strand:- start:92 stop:499 length:408 start_codon:yes stop_codon:yes gene_type:complete